MNNPPMKNTTNNNPEDMKPFTQACKKCYLGDSSVDLCACHYSKEVCPCHTPNIEKEDENESKIGKFIIYSCLIGICLFLWFIESKIFL